MTFNVRRYVQLFETCLRALKPEVTMLIYIHDKNSKTQLETFDQFELGLDFLLKFFSFWNSSISQPGYGKVYLMKRVPLLFKVVLFARSLIFESCQCQVRYNLTPLISFHYYHIIFKLISFEINVKYFSFVIFFQIS